MFIIEILHYLITFYGVFGGLIFRHNKNLLLMHILVVIFILMQWIILDDKCFLSSLSEKEETEKFNSFARRFGRSYTYKEIVKFNYVFLLLVLLSSVLFFNHYH